MRHFFNFCRAELIFIFFALLVLCSSLNTEKVHNSKASNSGKEQLREDNDAFYPKSIFRKFDTIVSNVVSICDAKTAPRKAEKRTAAVATIRSSDAQKKLTAVAAEISGPRIIFEMVVGMVVGWLLMMAVEWYCSEETYGDENGEKQLADSNVSRFSPMDRYVLVEKNNNQIPNIEEEKDDVSDFVDAKDEEDVKVATLINLLSSVDYNNNNNFHNKSNSVANGVFMTDGKNASDC